MSGRPSTSPFWVLLAPAAAFAAALARWLLQGSGNLYTTPDKRFYLPDAALGWRIHPDGPLWLGMDALAVLLALAVGLAAAAWFVRRRERAQGTTWRAARAGLWLLGAAPLILPILAFASGTAPEGSRDQLPPGVLGPKPEGIDGSLADLPAGRYRVLPGSDSAVIARVTAGGETFEARFTGKLDGSLVFDPADLSKPVSAELRVDSASVDTGVSARSKHAREGYLLAEKHPEIKVSVSAIDAARQGASPHEIAFWASGTLAFMGKSLSLPVAGTARVLDEAARAQLGAGGPALLVSADLELPIADSPLAGDAGDFDTDAIPIHVLLVLSQASE